MPIGTSSQFTYVPFVGHDNIVDITDNDDGGATKKLFVDFVQGDGSRSKYVPKNAVGDGGNGSTVDSFTDKDPEGRRGNMITHCEILGEGGNPDNEDANFLIGVEIPAGMAPGASSPLLDPKYSLSNQPPAESFDYSRFLPIVTARCALSMYGKQVGSGTSSGPFVDNDRFPTVPTLAPFDGAGCGGTFLYIPQGFYKNINTILNDALGLAAPDQFNIAFLDPPQYGVLIINVLFDNQEGSGNFTVDFSHTVAN